jgi:hypothetical protein
MILREVVVGRSLSRRAPIVPFDDIFQTLASEPPSRFAGLRFTQNTFAIAMRYDKLARDFLAGVRLAAVIIPLTEHRPRHKKRMGPAFRALGGDFSLTGGTWSPIILGTVRFRATTRGVWL